MAREGDTTGERERLPERPMKIIYSLSPRVSLSRAPFFPVPITSKRLLRRLRERHERRVRAPAREPRENRLLPLPSRVPLARPILSFAHYFQAPATQAGKVYACVMLSLMVMLMLVLVRASLVRTGLYKAKLQINFSLSYRC